MADFLIAFLGNCVGNVLFLCKLACRARRTRIAIAACLARATGKFCIVTITVLAGCDFFIHILGYHILVFLWNLVRGICPKL